MVLLTRCYGFRQTGIGSTMNFILQPQSARSPLGARIAGLILRRQAFWLHWARGRGRAGSLRRPVPGRIASVPMIGRTRVPVGHHSYRRAECSLMPPVDSRAERHRGRAGPQVCQFAGEVVGVPGTDLGSHGWPAMDGHHCSSECTQQRHGGCDRR